MLRASEMPPMRRSNDPIRGSRLRRVEKDPAAASMDHLGAYDWDTVALHHRALEHRRSAGANPQVARNQRVGCGCPAQFFRGWIKRGRVAV